MCDISKKSRKKTAIVYKGVIKRINPFGQVEYYSYFVNIPVRVGVIASDKSPCLKDQFYNVKMIGRCSGFAELRDAKKLIAEESGCVVLKMEITKDIMSGTTAHISSNISYKHKIYAGKEILSIEEVE